MEEPTFFRLLGVFRSADQVWIVVERKVGVEEKGQVEDAVGDLDPHAL